MNIDKTGSPLHDHLQHGRPNVNLGQQPTNGLKVTSSPISISISGRPPSSANLVQHANTGDNTTSRCRTQPLYKPDEDGQSSTSSDLDLDIKSDDSPLGSATPDGGSPPSGNQSFTELMVIVSRNNSDNSGDSTSSEEDDEYPNAADRARAYLEAQGIEVDLKDSNDITALMVAAWENQERIVESLLEVGVPVHCVNAATGDNALILAASLGHAGVVEQLLKVQGIDLNKSNKNGDTALMLASSGKWPDVVETLLNHGAKADLVNFRRGYNALMLASAYGCARIVELLLGTTSVNLNQTNPRGDTALILACAGKHRDAAEVLLKAGANATTVGSQGHTALGMAIAVKDCAIVELFIDVSPETVDDLNLSPDLQDAFSVTVTDLLAMKDGSAQFVSSDQPLDFFKTLSGLVPADGDTGALVRWLRAQGLLTACARDVASLLAPADAWALQADHGSTGGKEQQRLVYCISALGQIMLTGARERVSKNYQNAGVSEQAMGRLSQFAEKQLRDLENLAGEAAAQFGGGAGQLDHRALLRADQPEVRASRKGTAGLPGPGRIHGTDRQCYCVKLAGCARTDAAREDQH